MLREGESIEDLEAQLAWLYADLYQMGWSVSLRSFENLCRKIHIIEFKIYSFKGGRYGKK